MRKVEGNCFHSKRTRKRDCKEISTHRIIFIVLIKGKKYEFSLSSTSASNQTLKGDKIDKGYLRDHKNNVQGIWVNKQPPEIFLRVLRKMCSPQCQGGENRRVTFFKCWNLNMEMIRHIMFL